LTFAPGEQLKTISVQVATDFTDEPNETFEVVLSNVLEGSLADSVGVVTIIDDDVPSVSVADASVTEGTIFAIVGSADPWGRRHFTVVVSLPSPAYEPASVQLSTRDGTAVAGSDYVANTQTIDFAVGEQHKGVTLSVYADNVDELDEAFEVVLSDAAGASLGDRVGVVTILDDDMPSLAITDTEIVEGSWAPGQPFTLARYATLEVSLSWPAVEAASVQFTTQDVTASAGSDYMASTGSVTFAPGEQRKTIRVQVEPDVVDEPDELVRVLLFNPVEARFGDSIGQVTIRDDDLPVASVDDATVTEGTIFAPVGSLDLWGRRGVTVRVLLSGPAHEPARLVLATRNVTALAGSDYVAGFTVVNFAVGERVKLVELSVYADNIDEPHETFQLLLSDPTGAQIGDGIGVVTIVDDDVPRVSVGDANVTEGDGRCKSTGGFGCTWLPDSTSVTVRVTLSSPAIEWATVRWETEDGSAIAGSDYGSASGALTFAPGQSVKTIALKVLGDVSNEINEFFKVRLSSPVGATLGDAVGVITIIDDD
jgi:hypothetical protein